MVIHVNSDMVRDAAKLRRFTRFYTKALGLFSRRLPGGSLTLAQARVLYELRRVPGCTAADLQRDLAMDRGQMSRIVARLVEVGFVARQGEASGRRGAQLVVTGMGGLALDTMEKAANEQAEALLFPLDTDKRARLMAALAETETLLTRGGTTQAEYIVAEAESGDMGWVIQAHAREYGREYGYDQEFERYVLLGMAAFAGAEDKERSGLWLARRHEQGCRPDPEGSVAMVAQPGNTAQLRWLLVLEQARGHGLGRSLVTKAVEFARDKSYSSVFLWTLAHLGAARRLYEQAGFVLVETRPGSMGGRPVEEEKWVLGL